MSRLLAILIGDIIGLMADILIGVVVLFFNCIAMASDSVNFDLKTKFNNFLGGHQAISFI